MLTPLQTPTPARRAVLFGSVSARRSIGKLRGNQIQRQIGRVTIVLRITAGVIVARHQFLAGRQLNGILAGLGILGAQELLVMMLGGRKRSRCRHKIRTIFVDSTPRCYAYRYRE